MFIPAPWVIEGGGGLSTICGFCVVKREKKLAHISILFFIVNPYKFRFFFSGEADQKNIKRQKGVLPQSRMSHENAKS
jgi:hypothetical protein